MKIRCMVVLATLALLSPAIASPLAAQEDPPVPQIFDWHLSDPVPDVTPWGQAIDTASTRLILSWTTMPEYTNPTVNHLPDHPEVISPTRHFGQPIGEPGTLHKVDEIYGYMSALAGSTPRVNFELLGETEEGNNLALVQVGSESNLARLERVREAMNALADPRETTQEEAERLIAEMPVIYTFYAGLHSPETGPPEMVMEMAYRLAISDDPMIRAIRDSVVVFIVPAAEPDGRNRVVEWHQRYNSDVFDNDDRTPGPPFWGKYIFHDNNRDGLQLSARLTQELTELFLDWKFPVGHDLHESVPYLYVSTGTGPYNNTVDPITISEWQWFSNYEVTSMTAEGMPGVWTHGFYDGWYPGYLLWVTNTRNAVGRFYETFGNSIPNTMERELGESSTRVHWYRPNPPREHTVWSLRNNTNYMQTGALNALFLVAQNRTMILDNFWRKSGNSLDKGRAEAPYGFVVPAEQERKADAAYMLNLVRRQGVEVHRATAEATYGDVTVRPGDHVIRMDQPYRNYVLTLMERQDFPEDAPTPYDDVAWTFPLMFNVTVHEVDDPAIQSLDMSMVDAPVTLAGTHRRDAGRRASDLVHVVVPNASAHLMKARYALGEAPVRVAEEAITSGDRAVAPGAWLIGGEDMSEEEARTWGADHGLELLTVEASAVAGVASHDMTVPRIAVVHTWARTQDAGWTRFTFDEAGIPYSLVGEESLEGMDLRDEYDVIVFPTQGARTSSKAIFQGVDPKHAPLAYTRTPEYPTHGFPIATEDATGGMGFRGLAALRDFVDGGGTLIALGSASTIPVDFGFLREVTLRDAGSLFIPGSIVRGKVQHDTNPIAYGYEEEVPLYHQFGPYFNVPDSESGNVVLRYAEGGDFLMSGVARNGGSLGNQPALYSAPVGDGHVVIFGFDALHRHQNHGNHALVWNAMLNWDHLDAGERPEPEEAVAEEADRH